MSLVCSEPAQDLWNPLPGLQQHGLWFSDFNFVLGGNVSTMRVTIPRVSAVLDLIHTSQEELKFLLCHPLRTEDLDPKLCVQVLPWLFPDRETSDKLWGQ